MEGRKNVGREDEERRKEGKKKGKEGRRDGRKEDKRKEGWKLKRTKVK